MRLSFITILLLSGFSATCQSITGYISGSGKQPLEGATIANTRTGFHAHKNELGAFQIAGTQTGDTLKVMPYYRVYN